MLFVHVRQQGLHQLRDVFLVLTQRRHVNVENVEAVVKIVAQFAAGNRFFGNFVGGRQNADIHRGLHLAAQPAQFAVFENAQQFGLRGHRHFADFIQQQSSAFGQFEASRAPLQRPGECAFFVAEDFAFDQGFGNGGAIDGNEWFVPARAEFMNGAGHQFLAGAARAGNQHRGRAGCNHFDEVKDLLHFLG